MLRHIILSELSDISIDYSSSSHISEDKNASPLLLAAARFTAEKKHAEPRAIPFSSAMA